MPPGTIIVTLELGVPVLAVDNASADDTVARIQRYGVEVVTLPENRGAAGRNIGAERAGTPYVAFCDGDGWFEGPGLKIAVDLLDQHPSLALVNARILANDEERLDPISQEVGGYERRFFIGGEEETLAIPLLRKGWRMRYIPESSCIITRAARMRRTFATWVYATH